MYNENWGRFGFILRVHPSTSFFSQFMLGSQGMPRRYACPDDAGFQIYHIFSTCGSYIHWLLRRRAPAAGRSSIAPAF